MEKQIRVLQVTTVFKAAGIESFIMNMYRNIDRSKVQFDFMVMRNEEEFYDEEIKQLGGKKFTISSSARNVFVKVLKESMELYKFLQKNPYEIIHIHYTTPLRAFYILAAKRAGVKIRIYHSHSAEVSGKSKIKQFIYNWLRKCIGNWGTHNFACSEVAAQWMFSQEILASKRYKVIYNGIDVNKFQFNLEDRNAVRRKLRIEDRYVIIHTGRFLEQKNHRFILEVFKELKSKCSDAYLLLLGSGDLFENIQQLVKQYNLENDVCFLGVRPDVNRYLSAADCYIMPSLYEGLPVAAVEAECADLPCVFSTNITDEVALTERVTFLSLDEQITKWCDVLLKYRNLERRNVSDKIVECGYDVKSVAEYLQKFYIDKHGE
jgi:glycosyltransferase involved in cell wall biosynthesis